MEFGLADGRPSREEDAGLAAVSFDLSGRVAMVTGGTRGLGRAIALGLADAGADVIVSSRKPDACEQVAREIRERGRQALGHPCHVGRWADLDRLVDAAYERFGRVDVLVNNAGISPLYSRPEEITEELWDKVQAVNLKGPFRLAATVGARMAGGEGGSIINVSSIGAVRVTADILPYGAAKAGLIALTVGFADALGPNVRVNCIMAGPFLTDISKGWDMDKFQAQATGFPLRRAGRPEEIVGAALYFASDASSFTTGAVLTVDGGVVGAAY
jgi:NAD(P)-dependent dehydrogenase (short-subunit alcohol dehydrogenase family)